MTLLYAEFSSTIGLKTDLIRTVHALAKHVMEMFRRKLPDSSGGPSQVLDRLTDRLAKIAAELRKHDRDFSDSIAGLYRELSLWPGVADLN